ncbi:unnamed protein product [Amoebophrya sp. A120]|nr:unnamed protein product [Amoebophrya sp. A120]|eukprot:GSA120T00011446001.1
MMMLFTPRPTSFVSLALALRVFVTSEAREPVVPSTVVQVSKDPPLQPILVPVEDDDDPDDPDDEYTYAKALKSDPFFFTRTSRLRRRFWPSDVEGIQWDLRGHLLDERAPAPSCKRKPRNLGALLKGRESATPVETCLLPDKTEGLKLPADSAMDSLRAAVETVFPTTQAKAETSATTSAEGRIADNVLNICVLGPLDRHYLRTSVRPLVQFTSEEPTRRLRLIAPRDQLTEVKDDLLSLLPTADQLQLLPQEHVSPIDFDVPEDEQPASLKELRAWSAHTVGSGDSGSDNIFTEKRSNTTEINVKRTGCHVLSLHAGSQGFHGELLKALSGNLPRTLLLFDAHECDRGANRVHCSLLLAQFRRSHCGTPEVLAQLEAQHDHSHEELHWQNKQRATENNPKQLPLGLWNPDCFATDANNVVQLPVRSSCVCVADPDRFVDAEDHLAVLEDEQCREFQSPSARFEQLHLMERFQRRSQLRRTWSLPEANDRNIMDWAAEEEAVKTSSFEVFAAVEEDYGAEDKIIEGKDHKIADKEDGVGVANTSAEELSVPEEDDPEIAHPGEEKFNITRGEFLEHHGFPTNLFQKNARSQEKFLGYSQWRQDWFLFHNFFRYSPSNGRQGFFLDLGASQPTILSNTAAFEKCLDWKGLCVEPNPSRIPALLTYRNCLVVPFCVAKKEKVLTLMTDHAGAAEGMASEAAEPSAVPDKEFEDENAVDSLCFRLEKLLDQISVGSASEVRHAKSRLDGGGQSGSGIVDDADDVVEEGLTIDLISLDVEGQEVDILEKFPFNKFYIRVFLIETDHSNSLKLDILLIAGGYVKVALLGKDAMYIHHKFAKELATWGKENPLAVEYPEYVTIHPYYEHFSTFQRRFLDPDFGERR